MEKVRVNDLAIVKKRNAEYEEVDVGDGSNLLTEVCAEQQGRKNSHNGVS
jgi:hypothetical protein